MKKWLNMTVDFDTAEMAITTSNDLTGEELLAFATAMVALFSKEMKMDYNECLEYLALTEEGLEQLDKMFKEAKIPSD